MQQITTPRDTAKTAKGVTMKMRWDKGFGANRTNRFMQAQKFVDNEVLRCNEPFIPRQTGALIRSGNMGTLIGSGLVSYIAPYAAKQYYGTASTRSYDAQRGGHWFTRMKTVHGRRILRSARSITGGK